jgi:hypothetical protein
VSLRGCTTRLARIEKAAAARRAAGPDLPDYVVVLFDEWGVGHLDSVVGPYRGCVCGGWPQEAYEPFEGSEAELDAYYERHGWQPGRTVLLWPYTKTLRASAHHET